MCVHYVCICMCAWYVCKNVCVHVCFVIQESAMGTMLGTTCTSSYSPPTS